MYMLDHASGASFRNEQIDSIFELNSPGEWVTCWRLFTDFEPSGEIIFWDSRGIKWKTGSLKNYSNLEKSVLKNVIIFIPIWHLPTKNGSSLLFSTYNNIASNINLFYQWWWWYARPNQKVSSFDISLCV